MQFASPALLFGLALCTLPILIHLLMRRHYRREPWAAMRFLRAALARRSQQLRLESLLLLLLRTLVLGLLVLAAAEPLFFRGSDASLSRAPIHRILVLDASASMGRITDRERAYDIARKQLDRLLDESAPGDAFHLVRISEAPPRALIRRATYDPEDVRAELSSWGLTEERGDVAAALQTALELLRQTPEPMQKELIIVSDLQQSNWLPENPATRARIRGLLTLAAQLANLRFVDVGDRGGTNLGITSLEASRPVVARGQPVQFRATIRNFSDGPVATRLEWYEGGQLADVAAVEVAAASDVTVERIVTAAGSGGVAVEARLAVDDALPADNRRFAAVRVRDALRVLLVDGRPSLRPMQGAADYLRMALAPVTSTQVAATNRLPILTDLIPESELATASLEDVDCLWLCDVPNLSPELGLQLENFVRRGGGLVITAGDGLTPEAYNNWRASDGTPLLPVMLSEVVDAVGDGERWTSFAPTDPPHPLLAPFRDYPDAGLTTTFIRRYLRAKLSAGAPAQVLLNFTTGDPAIVERELGLGRVAVVLTAVDDRWGAWAVWPSFPPLVYQLSLSAALGGLAVPQQTVGVPFEREWRVGRIDHPAAVTLPGGQRVEAAPQCDALVCRLRFTQTTTPGVYAVDPGLAGLPAESLVVNVDPSESSPGRLSERGLSTELLAGARYAFATEWSAPRLPMESAVARGSLSNLLLMAALTLLLVEQLMAWRSRWGLVALALCGLAAVVSQTVRLNAATALALMLVIASASLVLRQRLLPGRSPGP